MATNVLIGLLIVSWCGFIVISLRQRRRVQEACARCEKVREEEERVFDFFHGLGEAFSKSVKPGELHRLIVEGAMRILNTQGGALYMADHKGRLVARYVSAECPPLVAIPAELHPMLLSAPHSMQGYQRLRAVDPGEGVVGRVWLEGGPLVVNGDDPQLDALGDGKTKPGAMLAAPLVYSRENLGVIVLANGAGGAPFSASDFAIFKAIAEQAAFALYNAIIYSEASEKRRMEMDLQTAQEVQAILLPEKAPDMAGYEISGRNLPAREVSGDYFDFIRIDEHRVGAVIADVSGKGVPAALLMAICRGVLRIVAEGKGSAADVMRSINRRLYPDIREDMFISMAYLILDDRTGTVTLCRAGHDAPLLYEASEKQVRKLTPPGMALGIDSGVAFDRVTADFSVTLEKGDCLILYTDGVTEALDHEGREFGLANLTQSIQMSASRGTPEVIERVIEDVQDFIGSEPRHDDITLIAIRKK
jgi:phosphoserine phosphatase RsbU/P